MINQKQTHIELGNQLYRNYIQPANQDVFEIFNDRLKKIDPLWYEKKILDFGCNVGHLVATSAGKIKQQNFVGVDIHEPALNVARTNYPEAEWLHYNCYNSTFNPTGIKGIPLPTNKKFDYVISYGVFTHCDIVEIKRQINILKTHVVPGGSIFFSMWLNIHLDGYINFLKNCFGINLNLQKNFSKSLYLINREYAICDQEDTGLEDCLWLETFYNPEYLFSIINGIEFMPGIYSHHAIFRLPVP